MSTAAAAAASSTSSTTMEINQSAAREARRFLADRVRNDWRYPSPPPPFEHSDEELRGVAEFRERYYGTTSADEQFSDNDNDNDNDNNDTNHDIDDKEEKGNEEQDHHQHQRQAKGPYKFDSPDNVAQTLEQRAVERAERRKRKRRRVLEEEMQWNEGMAVFVRRRDAWTGAASVRKYARRRSRSEDEMHPAELDAQRQLDAILDDTAVKVDADESAATNTTTAATAEEEDKQPAPNADQHQHPQQPQPSTTTTILDIPSSEEPLVPVAAPLLPTNTIRRTITARAYSDIYTKIVVGGQSPKVPINLVDMTRALVQGWKEDGEWPPRSGPLDPLIGGRRKGSAAAGGGVMGARGVIAAALGGGSGRPLVGLGGGPIGEERGASAAGSAGQHHGGGGGGEFLAHHPHVKKGVESVKRVFRLSGSHANHESHSEPGAKSPPPV